MCEIETTECWDCDAPATTERDGDELCQACADRRTYWRIQDAGLPLSRSHRSRTWSLDDDDEGEEHAGTSVVLGVHRLPIANPSLHAGAVEIVELEGDEAGSGWDGEPVVIPTRELRRFRLSAERRKAAGSLLPIPSKCTVEALLAEGWEQVETLGVQP